MKLPFTQAPITDPHSADSKGGISVVQLICLIVIHCYPPFKGGPSIVVVITMLEDSVKCNHLFGFKPHSLCVM